MRGSYRAVHMDMRITFPNYNNVTVISSSFSGGWRQAIVLPNAPWKVDAWFDVTLAINADDDTFLVGLFK